MTLSTPPATPIPAMPAPPPASDGRHVRQDIWTLQPEAAPFHPIVTAYARAVGVLKAEPGPRERSWRHQYEVHGLDPDPRDGLRNQCQHNSWYFLPWHRMYLYHFEQICRSIIQAQPDIDEDVKRTWALPYWDYDRPEARRLPPPFRARFIDGDRSRPNPLFDPERDPDVNSGAIGLTAFETTAAGWFRAQPFASRFPNGASFGGPTTSFHHFSESGSAAPGPLERTPHGNVHVTVGGQSGKMGDFNRAAGDPVFWLHHANIDRLWSIWQLNTGAGLEPADPRFLRRTFDFISADGSIATLACGDVLHTADLDYSYSDLSIPASAGPTAGLPMPTDSFVPPQALGALDESMRLVRGAPRSVGFELSDFVDIVMADPANPRRALLMIDHIQGPRRPRSVFGVFLEPDDGGEAAFVGTLPMFGMVEASRPAAEHGLSYVFDVTETLVALLNQRRWQPTHLQVTFRPINEAAERAPDTEDVTIGTVALMAQ